MIKVPEELTKEDLWVLLGAYADQVGEAEGVLFTDNIYVKMAADQVGDMKDKYEINNAGDIDYILAVHKGQL